MQSVMKTSITECIEFYRLAFVGRWNLNFIWICHVRSAASWLFVRRKTCHNESLASFSSRFPRSPHWLTYKRASSFAVSNVWTRFCWMYAMQLAVWVTQPWLIGWKSLPWWSNGISSSRPAFTSLKINLTVSAHLPTCRGLSKWVNVCDWLYIVMYNGE